MNHNILVEAKKEYTNQLLQVLKPRIYEGFKSIYDDTVSILGKEYIEYNTQTSSVIKSFQKALRDIPLWNQEMINREYERILNSSKCDYFEDLIETVFITNIKILSSVQMNSNDPIGLQVNIPSPVHFIHKCYIESAKEIYKNPYVFENSKNMTPKEKHTNIRDSITYIENSINSAIRELLPIRDILRQGISKTNLNVNNSLVGGNNASTSSEEKIKKVEYSINDEKDDDTEESDDTEATEVTEVTEDTEDVTENSSVLPSFVENKEQIQNPNFIETKNLFETRHGTNTNDELLRHEIPTKNDYVSQISEVSEVDYIKDDQQKIVGGSLHLFDKLSKSGNPGNINESVKNISANNELNPIYNTIRPIIQVNNSPPEIKEIFIGKQNVNNFKSNIPNIFSLKPKENKHNGLIIRNKLHNNDKTNSLYKKKYDEYIKNSQINSSSVNNTELKSNSSMKSNSKTILIEDASEYISDNIDF
jgi:flagellar biosynthesis/type III secretory pathway chaperone